MDLKIVVYVVFALIGLVDLGLAIYFYRRSKSFTELAGTNGRIVHARITEKKKNTSARGGPPHFAVSFRPLASQADQTGFLRVPADESEALTVGQEIDVRYLISDPSIFTHPALVETTANNQRIVSFAIGAAILMLPVVAYLVTLKL